MGQTEIQQKTDIDVEVIPLLLLRRALKMRTIGIAQVIL